MGQFAQDLSYSWRRLRRAPGFMVIFVLTLALGIGANTSLFSLVNGVLFKALPVPDLDRLVTVTTIERSTGRTFMSLSNDLRAAVEASGVVDQFVLRDPLVGALSAADQAEVIQGELVSGNYFQMMGVKPKAGRLLQPADDGDHGSDTPVVISERLWRQWFSADQAVLGTTVTMAGTPLVVVGVVPDDFKGTWLPTILAADIWAPLHASSRLRTVQGTLARVSHGTFATLRAGVSLEQARATIESVGRAVQSDGPSMSVAVLPARRGMVPDEFDRYGLRIASAVLALAGLVLLIACANLATLSLARGSARSGEIAIRLTMGASGRRIIQLLFAETALLVALAGSVGLGLAWATTRLMATVPLPALDGLSVSFDPSPDLRVFLYAFAAASLAALACGLVPSLHAAGRSPMRALKSGGATTGTTVQGRRVWTRLVAFQVAMSLVLLTGAGLFIRSTLKSLQFDPGYDTSNTAMVRVDLSMQKIDAARGRAVLAALLEAAKQAPGVQRAALASAVPAAGPTPRSWLVSEEEQSPDRGVSAGYSRVSPGFFPTLGIRLTAGRDFVDSDASARPVVIISQRVADRLWPRQDPIGRRLQLQSDGAWREVVGVAADTATSLQNVGAGWHVYTPIAQNYSPRMLVIIRTVANPASLLDPFRQTLRQAVPDVAVFDVRTMSDAVGLLLVPIRIAAYVLGALGALGFCIAILGVHGVVTHSVSQRRREFGVHRALGASEGQIQSAVLRQGLRMLMWGVVPGVILALLGAGFLRYALYGVQPRDPLTFVVVPATLIAAGLAACYWPARQAARVDPNVALRDL